jgi:RNA polymerase II subunit A small phosphatase-like protein
VRIRPGAEEFIEKMSKYFEIMIYTASMAEYANPVIDRLDLNGVCKVRLFRENCTSFNHYFVKDLSKLNRDLKNLIIIDVEHIFFIN